MIRAVLFDMDGVLTDTERSGCQMMRTALARQGYSITEDQFISLVGTSMEETNRRLLEWLPGVSTDQFATDWKDATFEYVHTYGVPVKPHAAEVLDQLRAEGYLLGLCTNNVKSVVMEYLTLLGWEHKFDTIITAEMVQRRKPDPDTYLAAARALQCAPHECAGVEDSPSGLLAVAAAGMYCVRIPDLIDTSHVPASSIHLTLDTLAQLPDALRRQS